MTGGWSVAGGEGLAWHAQRLHPGLSQKLLRNGRSAEKAWVG